jgi:dTDP-4-dehydrorhamnose reductase
MKTKVLILGASGMAGHVITIFLRSLSNKYDVLAIARSNSKILPTFIFDITDFDRLKKVVEEQEPHVIINCVGILNSNAEDHPNEAILINSYLPNFLEDLTKDTKSKIIHISTDCVFSGEKGGYKENDPRDGIGFYAQTKALGEIVNSKDLTIRTSIVGPDLDYSGIGLFNWFKNQRGEITGYNSAFWSGVTTIELARAIDYLIENNITGLYHLTNAKKISKYNLLNLFLEVFNDSEITNIKLSEEHKIDKSLINTRSEVKFEASSYQVMVKEMKNWVKRYYDFYPHYHQTGS